MKKVIALALSLMLAAPALTMAQAPAAAATEKKSGAILSPDEEKYDFGSIKQGESVEHTFTFKNTGTEPLVISNVAATCGCTVPEWSKEPVMPGKAGKVTAKFNSAGKMGQQNKPLTISSNNGAGNVVVTLVGTVTDPAATATAATMTAAAPMMEAKATSVEKGKIKTKNAKTGKKEKVKMTEGKVEVKK